MGLPCPFPSSTGRLRVALALGLAFMPLTAVQAQPLALKMDLQLGSAAPSDRGPVHRNLSARITADHEGGSLRAELSHQEAYGETGQVLALGISRDLGPDWLVTADAQASDASRFLARWRLEGGVGRKWLADRSLVTLASVARSAARDGHRDQVLSVAAQWYARPGWVLQAGWRQTRSEPGPVSARRAFMAMDLSSGPHSLVLQHEWGREAWVLIDPSATAAAQVKTDLFSRWTRWQYAYAVTPDWQLTAGQSWYRRDGYGRHGLEIGSRFPLTP